MEPPATMGLHCLKTEPESSNQLAVKIEGGVLDNLKDPGIDSDDVAVASVDLQEENAVSLI